MVEKIKILTYDQITHSVAPYMEKMDCFSVDRNPDINKIELSKYDLLFIDFCDERAIELVKRVHALSLPRPRVVLRIHAYEIHMRFITKICWDAVSDIIFVSKYYKELFIRLLPPKTIEHIKMCVISNVIDFNKFSIPKEPKDDHKVAILSSISPKKGATLLGVVAASFSNFSFDVGGRFQDERIRLYLEHLALPNLKFHGYAKSEELLVGKSFLVSCSPLESCPVGLAEAMAMGVTPAILDYPGAVDLWHPACLWRSVQDLAVILERKSLEKNIYDPDWCRDWVKARYPVENISKIVSVLLNSSTVIQKDIAMDDRAKQTMVTVPDLLVATLKKQSKLVEKKNIIDPGISLAMIVRNEVTTLEKVVETARPFVDEVVIGIDTRSDDGSRELAQRIADKTLTVYLSEELEKSESVTDKTEWGFCAARNRVLDACSHPWRLILDGHDILKVKSGTLKSLLSSLTDQDGVEVRLLMDVDDAGIPKLLFNQVRLMKDTVRYANPIHNVPGVKKGIISKDIEVLHLKKHQEASSRANRDAQRSQANVAGLRKKVEENPKDSRSWYYLGMTYRDNGTWEEAVKCYEKYLEVGVWKEERWHARHDMARCLKALGRLEEARNQLSAALDEFPVMAEAFYELGEMAYRAGHYQEARFWLEKCCTMDIPKCRLFVDPRIYMVYRWDMLSMIYHHLHMWQAALDAGEKVLLVMPNHARVKKNMEYWRKFLAEKK